MIRNVDVIMQKNAQSRRARYSVTFRFSQVWDKNTFKSLLSFLKKNGK